MIRSVVGVAAATLLVVVVSVVLRRGGAESDREAAPPTTMEPVAPGAASPPLDTLRGLRCIRGGTSREEVRALMGEPDSIVFGDWLYGRSSVTFGYGVVLDYANAGGNLVVCP